MAAHHLRVLSEAARVSLLDFFGMFNVRLYLLAWVPRILTQVAFYVLFAAFAGGPEFLAFALVGNAVQLMNQTATSWVTSSVTWEQRAGTLPLLLASPSSPLLVLSGRNFGMALHGYLTGIIGVFAVSPLLGLDISLSHVPAIAALLLLILLSCYGLGLLLGGIALRNRAYRSILSNLVTSLMLSLCGINYPVAALPIWLQPISHALPLTHGLMAIRGVLEGAPAAFVWQMVGLEILIGGAYLLAAQLVFRNMLDRGRRRGTLELH